LLVKTEVYCGCAGSLVFCSSRGGEVMGIINKIPRQPHRQKKLSRSARAKKEVYVIRYALFVLAVGAHVIPANIKEANPSFSFSARHDNFPRHLSAAPKVEERNPCSSRSNSRAVYCQSFLQLCQTQSYEKAASVIKYE
jgi:hypothetical protein